MKRGFILYVFSISSLCAGPGQFHGFWLPLLIRRLSLSRWIDGLEPWVFYCCIAHTNFTALPTTCGKAVLEAWGFKPKIFDKSKAVVNLVQHS